jgi:hypothetical protein
MFRKNILPSSWCLNLGSYFVCAEDVRAVVTEMDSTAYWRSVGLPREL